MQDPPAMLTGMARVSWRIAGTPYSSDMKNNDHLKQHLDLCKRIYLRMRKDGAWPWRDRPDSQKSGNLVESKDTLDDV